VGGSRRNPSKRPKIQPKGLRSNQKA
jgi:hypothetical protein